MKIYLHMLELNESYLKINYIFNRPLGFYTAADLMSFFYLSMKTQ